MGYGLWVISYGLWVMGHGLWVMGYGLWVMGYGLWVRPPETTSKLNDLAEMFWRCARIMFPRSVKAFGPV